MGGADVLAHHSHMGGQLAALDFLAGQQLDDLLLATGRVFGRHHTDFDIAALAGPLDRGNGLGLVVLDPNQGAAWVEQVLEDVDAGDDLVGMFTHQSIIGGDVRLALHRIDDQLFYSLMVAEVHLDAGGETRAPHSGNTGMADGVDQLAGAQLGVISHATVGDPFILAIGVEHHADGIHARWMLDRAGANGTDGAGSRRMNRGTNGAAGFGNHLPLEDPVAGGHQWLGRCPDMHVQRQHQLGRQRAGRNGGAVGQVLHFRWVNAAVEIKHLRAARTEQGTNHRLTTSIRLSGR